MTKPPPLRIASKRNHWSPKITRAFSTSSVITGQAQREHKISALPLKADIRADVRDVGFVPLAAVSGCSKWGGGCSLTRPPRRQAQATSGAHRDLTPSQF